MSTFLRGCALLFIVFGLATGCINDDGANKKEKEIVWQDEFDGSGSLNSDYWSYDIGTGVEIFGRPGWGNNELQYYTDRPENIRIRDGFLEITAREESFEGSDYTSARILTRGKFEKTFGRFEARIKLPFGQGIWPAFWLLGDDSNGTVSWPQIGEIDIMEYRGQEPTIVHGSVHGPGYSAGEAVTDSYLLSNSRFDTDFHVFAIEWGPDFIKYYVDDELYNEINPGDVNGEWVFNDNTFYIILNVAVGGSFVGSPNSRTPFPQTMVVDYVRVYAE
ncbi:glycoside hydrolase family 16 protein [Gracilimonas sp.]|uniref:glycoside hydrolase family 16 protein n=1 Tax=Gracilimonas sp. TaxID=1974203 RepID=UPI003D0AE916